MKYKITPGILAGIVGAVILGFYGMLMKALGFTDRIYLDFAKIIIMSEPYDGIAATIVGWVAHLFTGALFGMLLCCFISLTSGRFWVLKGWGTGVFTWYSLLSLGTVFRLPLFIDIHPQVALTLLSGSSVWGLTTVFVLKKITADFNTIIAGNGNKS